MVLFAARSLALDGVTRAAGAVPQRTTALNHKPRNDPMESEPVIKTTFRELNEIGYSAGCLFVVKFDEHIALLCVNDAFGHGVVSICFVSV